MKHGLGAAAAAACCESASAMTPCDPQSCLASHEPSHQDCGAGSRRLGPREAQSAGAPRWTAGRFTSCPGPALAAARAVRHRGCHPAFARHRFHLPSYAAGRVLLDPALMFERASHVTSLTAVMGRNKCRKSCRAGDAACRRRHRGGYDFRHLRPCITDRRMARSVTIDTVRLLRLTGFGLWALSGVPMSVTLAQNPALLHATSYQLWLTCFLVFGTAFALTGWRVQPVGPLWIQVASLVTQTSAALAMVGLVCSGQEGSLLVIVAAQLGWLLPLPLALGWILAQATAMCVILGLTMPRQLTLALVNIYSGFQILAFLSCFLTARESAARANLVQTNRELRATRELLANTSRLAERERLSRELHDTLGHHLTALSLNLEAARHLAADERTCEQVQRAQSVTSLLLRDVRGVVSALRGEDPMALTEALRILVDAVPGPRIHLQIADDLPGSDPLRAQTVVRCVQEVITNTIRHAHATNLWIEVAPLDGGLHITAKDDGRGAKDIRPGHGLIGMRERLEAVGGRLEVDAEAAGGFRIRAWIPSSEGDAS
jgi:signal transduction histidine kinase